VQRVARLILRPVRRVYLPLRERLARAIFAPGAELRTEGVVWLEELDLANPERNSERNHYKAVGWSILPRILPAREISSADVFIDYGSGMGRIVYAAAARYPFQRVIGLEVSGQLNEIARSNLDRNAHLLRCRNVELITADVLDYQPPSDITVAFFANPFTGTTFETAVGRLLDAVQGPLRIIYANPVEHSMLVQTGRLKVIRRLRGWRPGREWSRWNVTLMYEYDPR
jgi:Histone methylation protein DOT1